MWINTETCAVRYRAGVESINSLLGGRAAQLGRCALSHWVTSPVINKRQLTAAKKNCAAGKTKKYVNHHPTRGTSFLLLFVFLISLVHHHHPALLHRHTLILDRLLTFLIAFSTLVLKVTFLFSKSSLQSHLSVTQYHLLAGIWPLGVWQSLAVVVLVSAAD